MKKFILLISFCTAVLQLHAQNLTKPLIPGPAGLQVNSFTGNLFYQRTDLFIPGRGLSLDATFSYNSGESGKDWGYGNGVMFAYNMLWERDGSDIYLRSSDGRRDLYTWNGSGWTRPKGIFDSLLQYAPGKFRLRSKYGIIYSFDDSTHKRLTKIRTAILSPFITTLRIQIQLPMLLEES